MTNQKGRGSAYKTLLKDKEVKRWYNNVARGSVVTADVYLRRLGNFCQSLGTNPSKFAAKSEKEIYGILLDYVTELENRGLTGSYITSILKALRSWLSHNDKMIKKKIKVRDSGIHPTLKDERVPTPQELKRIFLSGDKKARVACTLLAHTGLRIQTLGSYTGDDGLVVGDIPEMKIEDGSVIFESVPAMVVVRHELSKAGHKYFSFLSEEGCEYLKDYLEERLRDGEKLSKDSPILTPKTARKPFISTTKVSHAIRGAMRSAGFQWRPYVLRSYFDTQLMLAESKGYVLRDYRTFWMGHVGDIEHRYTTNKGRLPAQVIEDMREAYGKGQEFLQTKVPEGPKEEDLKRMFRSELLRMAGFTDEEIEKDSLWEMSEEKLREIIREHLLGTKANNNCHQRVIGMDNIERYVAEGWEFVTALPNNKVILRHPS
ncbi:MAG: site-specific integrase [Methanomassiliicoccales archaeon]|nr:MAG: site-specific integrase [Methanomassiliicoccales archaeon]